MKGDLAIIALDFFKKRAIKFKAKGFKFNLHKKHPEAPLSPNYLNLRDVFRVVRIRKILARELLPIIKKISPDRLVDLPQSVTPLVTTLSDLSGIDMISIRSEALKTIKGRKGKKDYGVSQSITGRYRKGQTVLILDDVVSSFAHTKNKAIQVLRNAGLKVIRVVVIVVDREEGGSEMLNKKGFKLISLLKLKKIFRLYLKKGLITKEMYENSLKFSRTAKKYALKS